MKRQVQALLRKVRSLSRARSFTSVETSNVIRDYRPVPPPIARPLFNFTVDFELSWGNGRLQNGPHPPEKRLEAAERQLQNFLPFVELLEELDISISWAIVGILAEQGLENSGPRFAPSWSQTDWYELPKAIKGRESLYNGRPLIERVYNSSTKQEILSHGYAHIDFSDTSTTEDIALADLQWSKQALAPWAPELIGLAYPCNNPGHKHLLKSLGFRVFRGNTLDWKIDHEMIETPLGFWLSPGRMSWKELKTVIDEGIRQRAYIHPWMHLIECDLKQKDIDNFYRPLFSYIKEKEAKGHIENVSYEQLSKLF